MRAAGIVARALCTRTDPALDPKSARVARSPGCACKERVREGCRWVSWRSSSGGMVHGQASERGGSETEGSGGDCGRRKGKELTCGPRPVGREGGALASAHCWAAMLKLGRTEERAGPRRERALAGPGLRERPASVRGKETGGPAGGEEKDWVDLGCRGLGLTGFWFLLFFFFYFLSYF